MKYGIFSSFLYVIEYYGIFTPNIFFVFLEKQACSVSNMEYGNNMKYIRILIKLNKQNPLKLKKTYMFNIKLKLKSI